MRPFSILASIFVGYVGVLALFFAFVRTLPNHDSERSRDRLAEAHADGFAHEYELNNDTGLYHVTAPATTQAAH